MTEYREEIIKLIPNTSRQINSDLILSANVTQTQLRRKLQNVGRSRAPRVPLNARTEEF